MVDWQGDYNILPEHYARRPQTTSSLYLQPEYNLPAPTPSATPDSDYKLASPVAPFYDPRYDPFDLQERLFGDLQGYDTNGKPYALKVHLKPTQVSASSYGGQTTIAKCRGARTRC
ncbi:hypothetical protein OE88DRAFT_1657773 [Heliocybe sulcata]|uniref:Uncharacterized protein n=1 Tax=Heliocybe sulcata TaxID=5364 RepID=A0A5C3N5N2_9AGAM|nr:hypothetical protein OE88DRAFT_1657773 [Heliocybe sulcata]